MTGRRVLLAVAVASGALAGVLYFVSAQRVPVLVAARDVSVIRAIAEDDVSVVSLPPDALPPGVLSRPDDAIGKVPVAPLVAGQPLVARALAADAATFGTGLGLPEGHRAIAIPVSAVGAVGGAIAPGARVDIIAVPVLGRAPVGRTTELLAADALVLDVRGESGASLAPAAEPRVMSDRLASVVVAIAAADEIRFADRIVTSTFVLAFSSVR